MHKQKNSSGDKNTIKRQKKISARLTRSIALIFFVSIFTISIAYYLLPPWAYYLSPAVRLYLAVDEISWAYGQESFTSVLKDVEKQYDSNIEIYLSDGRFIYSSLDRDAEELPLKLSDAETVPEKYKLAYETTEGHLDSVTGDNRGFLIKVYNSGNIEVEFLVCFGYLPGGERIDVCMQVSQVATTTRIDFIVAFIFLMSALTIGFIGVTIYLRRFSKPIQKLCNITDRMAKLDFSQKCPPTKITEMNQLSESVNTLSDNLDKALTDLNERNEKLQRDIENEKNIENLRQIFVSGISHELKTPIAIIQGYAEGAKMFFEAGNTDAALQYCDIISEESVRMNNMVIKLLEITKYDSGAYEPQREDFNLKGFAEDWFERNTAILSEKEITPFNNIDESFTGNGDVIILASVLNNFLSNAVSHIDGERKIICRAEDMGERYRFYVFNTGSPIEEKHIDKLWTSFYRADKALSRSQGRFGLGLAIVASIQRLHNEAYGVTNKEDGVEFWFDIKKAEKPRQAID